MTQTIAVHGQEFNIGRLELVGGLIDYAERFADSNSEPVDGDCRRLIRSGQAWFESGSATIDIDSIGARLAEYVARFADSNEEPEGGNCRRLLGCAAAIFGPRRLPDVHPVQGIEARYGTRENPVTIKQAREAIRDDFLKFWQHVTDQVQMPIGHHFRNKWGSNPESELTWFGRCEIESTNSGASIHAGLAIADDLDTTQLSIEVRYFHPATHYKDGHKQQQVSRAYNDGYSAHLWVKQGRLYAGMNKSLITGHEFCRHVDSVEELAYTVVQRLKDAIARRELTHFDAREMSNYIEQAAPKEVEAVVQTFLDYTEAGFGLLVKRSAHFKEQSCIPANQPDELGIVVGKTFHEENGQVICYPEVHWEGKVSSSTNHPMNVIPYREHNLKKIVFTPGQARTAYEATAKEVENVLRSNSLAVANTNGKSFESMAEELHGELDLDLIEQAALAGDDLDEQTDCANDEIARQLRELGVLEPLKQAYDSPRPGM